jgi:pimeloyl-ACP methyl ester carboxylesterase
MATADLNWFLLYEALAGRHTVIAPDLRGHGRGIRSGRGFSLDDCAEDCAGLLRQLGIERAVVVGYSMGGPVALQLWRRHPSLVAGLVLEATGLQFASTRLQQTAWRLLGAGGVLLRWPTGRLVLLRLGGSLDDIPPELVPFREWADGEFRRNDPQEMVEAGRALSRFDARSYAGEVDVPTAVVVTTRDRLVPPGEQRALARATRAIVFEFDGDHSAVAMQPGEFAMVTLEAIAAVSRPVEAGAASG